MWHPNSNKHKAQHGGYRGKPTKGEVNALLSLYSSCGNVPKARPVKKQAGVQLKMEF